MAKASEEKSAGNFALRLATEYHKREKFVYKTRANFCTSLCGVRMGNEIV